MASVFKIPLFIPFKNYDWILEGDEFLESRDYMGSNLNLDFTKL